MWTFDNPPLKQLAAGYDFHPTRAWLDHLRLSSVRLNDGGSGSFVSPNGLLLTNHHVARGQLQKNSTAEHDYLRDGFYATTPSQEMKSPDLSVDVLESMEDVTGRVQDATKGIGDAVKAQEARDAEIAAIEKQSKDKTGLRSDVVSLYHGGEYWLYRYREYTDVRLVFAPEQQAAFFGGDPDNFTYPRYDLDMALFRVYDHGKPLRTPNYLKWSAKGAQPGELIFISGNPGSTAREETMTQLLLERDVREPEVIDYLEHRIAVAQEFAANGQEQSRLVGSTIFSLQNSLKVYRGRHLALTDAALIAKKEAEEKEFREKVAANPAWQAAYGDAWNTVAGAEERMKPEVKVSLFRRTDSRLFNIALEIVQYVAEVNKPDGERLPGFHDAQLKATRFNLLSPARIYPSTEKLFMISALKQAQQKLGENDAYVQAIVRGGDVDRVVDSLVDGTRLADPSVRKALLDGGEAAVEASSDPMIVAARRVDPVVRELRTRIRESVTSVLTPATEQLSKARFLVYGKDTYPDATFTLRLSYGTVKGYPYNGTVAPPFTTYYGLYDRSAGFSNKPPYNLTPKQEAGLSRLKLATPLDFVCTGDVIGGNSGSPVVNREGELVGVIFDGNIESLAGNFEYDGTKNRAVAVDSAGMIEGMRKFYNAGALADEIEGKP
ncbi:MAG TPA: S46 family peptidase [Terracidiphilus sp.]|nr:S46 family peptidase [Terracidiphilus sp.]